MSPTLRRLIDGHAHLNELENIAEALNAARAAGVAGIVGVGMDIVSNRRILELARQYPEITHA
jgi:Tat protein secretion system quality control protein TatD with DNase activity